MQSVPLYDEKKDTYFNHVRKDIQPLLSKSYDHVLELGCGSGDTLAWLKNEGIARHTTGMELCPEPAEIARQRVDCLIEGDLEKKLLEIPQNHYDLILCLDVLEHLHDPWAIVQQLFEKLRPGGSILVSIPNVRHYSVLLPLVFRGRWEYAEAGLLDRSHLRFFSRASAKDLLNRTGFSIAQQIDTGITPTRRREMWKHLFSRSPLRDFCVFQFLIRAEKLMPHKVQGQACAT